MELSIGKLKLEISIFKFKKKFRTRSSHRRCPVKKGVLKNLANLTGKHLCWSQDCNFIKKRLQHRCFHVKFAKF